MWGDILNFLGLAQAVIGNQLFMKNKNNINESNLPFKEEKINPGTFRRTFSRQLDDSELKWHTDKEDRIVLPVSSKGWKIQLDDEFPQDLKENKRYYIPKSVFHRLIKGEGDLIVDVTKLKENAINHKKEVLFESKKTEQFSESILYHIKNKISLNESVFRIGSESWLNLINEARDLYNSRKIELNEDEKFIVESNAGKKSIYKNKKIPLDVPQKLYENANIYEVYVIENEKVKRIIFKEE